MFGNQNQCESVSQKERSKKSRECRCWRRILQYMLWCEKSQNSRACNVIGGSKQAVGVVRGSKARFDWTTSNRDRRTERH